MRLVVRAGPGAAAATLPWEPADDDDAAFVHVCENVWRAPSGMKGERGRSARTQKDLFVTGGSSWTPSVFGLLARWRSTLRWQTAGPGARCRSTAWCACSVRQRRRCRRCLSAGCPRAGRLRSCATSFRCLRATCARRAWGAGGAYGACDWLRWLAGARLRSGVRVAARVHASPLPSSLGAMHCADIAAPACLCKLHRGVHAPPHL